MLSFSLWMILKHEREQNKFAKLSKARRDHWSLLIEGSSPCSSIREEKRPDQRSGKLRLDKDVIRAGKIASAVCKGMQEAVARYPHHYSV